MHEVYFSTVGRLCARQNASQRAWSQYCLGEGCKWCEDLEVLKAADQPLSAAQHSPSNHTVEEQNNNLQAMFSLILEESPNMIFKMVVGRARMLLLIGQGAVIYVNKVGSLVVAAPHRP